MTDDNEEITIKLKKKDLKYLCDYTYKDILFWAKRNHEDYENRAKRVNTELNRQFKDHLQSKQLSIFKD